jgi:hypothetical protein
MRLKPAFADELPDRFRMSIFTSARRDFGAPLAYTELEATMPLHRNP